MDAQFEGLARKLLAASTSEANPDAAIEELSRHSIDFEAARCSCGVFVADPLEHLQVVAIAAVEAGPARAARPSRRVLEQVGFNEGPTNRIDQLFDYGRTVAEVAELLGIPVAVVRRRRRERDRIDRPFRRRGGPVIAPDRQLEIALAALSNQSSTKEHAA
ncbi:MAG: hypothetical protein KGL39_26570 [Patescibacteria group bacterium]|nr:hypothetical protein [Patescibacteria group bacterium]